MPAVEHTYRENKVWCDRLAGVAVCVGFYTGMISLPTLCYLGSGFAVGALYCRGAMKEREGADLVLNDSLSDSSERLGKNSGSKEGAKEEIVELMKVIDDLLMTFLAITFKVDALTAERTIAAVNKLHAESSNKEGGIAQGLPVDRDLKEVFQIACALKPRILLAVLHELSGVNSVGEDICDMVGNKILQGEFNNPCPGICRIGRADYQQLADSLLHSGKVDSQDKAGLPVSEKVQVDILHGITASWNIADESRACELKDKIDKAASVAFSQWKKVHKGGGRVG
ncbi:hypothetical protein [Endozoicomonas sp. SCSIO W0465]|uniref:hypothetical protein n=1 Tax=Endozoicomonas sp. SCSIO W0465 TaxID=2918516 RepID=UPI002074B369|nr:hypothetical protein [Endozoicomonas sp. SCSIO W0465]USE37796.1 hypothetical protein MJO57_06280 [Endozoicomonas sp. SCSIO W0465]